MTTPNPKPNPKPMSESCKKLYGILVKSKREMPMFDLRVDTLSVSMAEAYLRQMASEKVILRRRVRLKAQGRAVWVFRLPKVAINPEYVDADDPSVKPTRKPQGPTKEKGPTRADYKKIMKSEPSNYRTLRDLPKGSEQVVDELYLADYYDLNSPNYLKDPRLMENMFTPDASGDIVQIIRDSSELQRVAASSPPDWGAVNSLAQSILISSANLMRDSLNNIRSEYDRK